MRLDTGLGLRLNQVTVTGKDYAKMVDFYRKLGLKQIVDSPENQYARFEAGGATFSIQCDPEAEIGETVAVYFECDDLDERVERLARDRASRSSMVRATSPGCGGRHGCATRRAIPSSSIAPARPAASRRGGWSE